MDHANAMQEELGMSMAVNTSKPQQGYQAIGSRGQQQDVAKPYDEGGVDFDKALIFFRDFRVMDVIAVDFASQNDLYFTLSFEEAPDGYASKLFTEKSDVAREAGSNATWHLKGMPHIQTHSDNVRNRNLKFELWDKNNIWKDKKIGVAQISLKPLLREPYEKVIELPIDIIGSNGKLVGSGIVETYMSLPFNWLTCGLHEPQCMKDFFASTTSPSLLNGFGCCHGKTSGQCHLPSGEKLCGLHCPECLNIDRPGSAANCGGFAHPKTFGTFVSIDEGCGNCGICSVSLRCCGHDLHCFPCLSDGCEELETTLGLPITFTRGRITVVSSKVTYLMDSRNHYSEDKEEVTDDGLPISINNKEYWYEMQILDDMGNTVHYYKSDVSRGGEWNMQPSFFASSEILYNHDVEIKLWHKNTFGRPELVGVGSNGHDLIELLKRGYRMQPTYVPVALRAIKLHKESGKQVHTVAAKLELQIRLQEDVPVLDPKSEGHADRRHGTLFMDQTSESIALTNDMFSEEIDKHMTKGDAQALIFRSSTDMEALIGYQIELFSKSTTKSKGIWVIRGVKKYKMFSAQYLLKNKDGGERWTVLEQPIVGSHTNATNDGKPFTLRRKVATFKA